MLLPLREGSLPTRFLCRNTLFQPGLAGQISQRFQRQRVKNIILEHSWYVSCTKMFLRIYWQGKQAGHFMIFSLCTVDFLFHLDLMSLVFFCRNLSTHFLIYLDDILTAALLIEILPFTYLPLLIIL